MGGHPVVNLAGLKFGKLTVTEFVGMRENQSLWLCSCECGGQKVVARGDLKKGAVKTCGCFNRMRKEMALLKKQEKEKKRLNAKPREKVRRERLYGVWDGMKTRCYNENDKAYRLYGAKGIEICLEWLDYNNFREWAYQSGYDENAKKYECTIDRIDNKKGYYPENCRWVNAKVQCNNRSTNIVLEYKGEAKTLAQWEEETGIDQKTLRARVMRYKWTAEKALTEPIKERYLRKGR